MSAVVNDAAGVARQTPAGRAPAVLGVTLAGRDLTEIAAANPLWGALRSSAAQVVISIPLTVGGTTVDRLAAGHDAARWRTLASSLSGVGKAPAVVRLTPPADSDAARAREALERVAATLKGANPGVLVEWVAPLGTRPDQGSTPPQGVDLVGVTLPTDGRWPQTVNGEGGLSDWSDWAAGQGKRLAVTWSIGADTSADTVRSVRAWLDVSSRAQRIGVETVRIAPDADTAAVAAYRAAW
ncbi:MAG: hypothetical protein ABI746_06340 [Dermatophilaceae bacterium]